MSNWLITDDPFENPFEILSSVNYQNIITLTCEPLSLRELCLHNIKDTVMTVNCQLCALISMELPDELEQDLLKILPGEYLVSNLSYLSTTS